MATIAETTFSKTSNWCLREICVCTHFEQNIQNRALCYVPHCENISCHHLCTIEMMQRATVKVAAEDIPKLCWKHVPAYLNKFDLVLEDISLEQTEAGSPARSKQATSSAASDSRVLSADFEDQTPPNREALRVPSPYKAPPQSIGEETYDLVNWLLAQSPQTFETAATVLAERGIRLTYTTIKSGADFDHAELVLLCGCGALYERRYKQQRRTQEFWNCVVPVIFANKLGKIRATPQEAKRDIGNNRYYDRWRRLKKGYDQYRKLMKGTGAPKNVAECRECVDRLKTKVKGQGCKAIIPYVPIIMEALEDFGDCAVVAYGLGTLDMPTNHDHHDEDPIVPVEDEYDDDRERTSVPIPGENRVPDANRPPRPAAQQMHLAPTETPRRRADATPTEPDLSAKQLFKFLTRQQENREKVFLAQHGQLVQDISEGGRLSADAIQGLSSSVDRLGVALERMSFVMECHLVRELVGHVHARELYASVPRTTTGSSNSRTGAKTKQRRFTGHVHSQDPLSDVEGLQQADDEDDPQLGEAEDDEEQPSVDDEDEPHSQSMRMSKRSRPHKLNFHALHTGKDPSVLGKRKVQSKGKPRE